MKQAYYIILSALLFTGCYGRTSNNVSVSKSTAVANKTVILTIEGMSCTGCENTIQEAVSKIPGIIKITASYLDSTAVVSYDSTFTTIPLIGEAITNAGYDFKGQKNPVIK